MSNDDGDWVLLNSESVERHCQRSVPHIEAWCMRANKYLNSEQFLVPVNGKTGGPKAPTVAKGDDDKRAAVAIPDTPQPPNRETYVFTQYTLSLPFYLRKYTHDLWSFNDGVEKLFNYMGNLTKVFRAVRIIFSTVTEELLEG